MVGSRFLTETAKVSKTLAVFFAETSKVSKTLAVFGFSPSDCNFNLDFFTYNGIIKKFFCRSQTLVGVQTLVWQRSPNFSLAAGVQTTLKFRGAKL
ncbi:MAG: hypothetical protein DRR08_09865 [Candidatus Parabeggiatoa sp. nov. 2]|nr:MAG: hypothetical protein B6247_12240 [Beggiatoa sp. 4572_84]RKZ61014.1 MAG: hypothetical protein DRR08_09865 [Gammaproteobacteria bacterium]